MNITPRCLAIVIIALHFTHTTHSQPAWTEAAALGNGATPRYNACGLSIGTKGYIGLGFFNSNFYSDFFEYDAALNSWVQRATFPGTSRSGVSAFAIGTKGYVGLGY